MQGLLLAVVILRKATRHPKSNQLIAALLLIFFLACVGLIVKEWQAGTSSWISIFPFYHLILVGPIVYLLVRSEMEPGFEPSRKDLIHFLFGIWSFRLVLLSVVGPGFAARLQEPLYTWFKYFYDYGDLLVWLVTTSYLVLGLITYKNYKSSPRSIWIKQFLDLFVFFQFAIWLPVITLYISPFESVFEGLRMGYETVYLPFAMLTYWIGFKWFSDSPTLTFKSVTKRFLEKRLSPDVPRECIEDLYDQVKKYRIHQHQDVMVEDMARLVNVSEDTIIYLLHQELGKTFSEFLEGIRVQMLLSESKMDELKQLSFEDLCQRNGLQTTDLGIKALEEYTNLSKRDINALLEGREQSRPEDETLVTSD